MAKLTLKSGDELYYEVHGDGEPLMLVSGLSGTATFWTTIYPTLAERYRVVLHDHRGTGRSTHARIRYSVEQMTDDVIELMDALGIERAHLIGHSTGGAIGQTMALDRPERLGKLVLTATWTAADAYFRRLFEVRGDSLRNGGPRAYVRSNAIYMRPPWSVRDDIAAIEAQEQAIIDGFPPPEVMLDRIDAICRFDRRADLPRIQAPTLVIGARDDIVTPVYYSEELGRLIPGATTVLLPQGGHFFPQLLRTEFTRTVLDFLSD
ncbi:MAG: alpha/beta hydrolase [Rhodospirillaceae bacterium]|nr:alpha/beta hydrolase [Rhodospirillaceae bacterium]